MSERFEFSLMHIPRFQAEDWPEDTGHAYLTKYRDAAREECARLLGIDKKRAKALNAPFAIEYEDECAECK